MHINILTSIIIYIDTHSISFPFFSILYCSQTISHILLTVKNKKNSMMIRCFFNPSLQQSGCCHGLKKPAFESPKRGLSVTDTPAGGPTSVLFASSVENSFRRLTTTPYERTMRNGRLNECFSFPRFLVIMGTRVPCD